MKMLRHQAVAVQPVSQPLTDELHTLAYLPSERRILEGAPESRRDDYVDIEVGAVIRKRMANSPAGFICSVRS